MRRLIKSIPAREFTPSSYTHWVDSSFSFLVYFGPLFYFTFFAGRIIELSATLYLAWFAFLFNKLVSFEVARVHNNLTLVKKELVERSRADDFADNIWSGALAKCILCLLFARCSRINRQRKQSRVLHCVCTADTGAQFLSLQHRQVSSAPVLINLSRQSNCARQD